MVFHGEKHIARIPHHAEAITTVMMIHLIALMKFLFMTNLTIIIKIQIESCIQSERRINGSCLQDNQRNAAVAFVKSIYREIQ